MTVNLVLFEDCFFLLSWLLAASCLAKISAFAFIMLSALPVYGKKKLGNGILGRLGIERGNASMIKKQSWLSSSFLSGGVDLGTWGPH